MAEKTVSVKVKFPAAHIEDRFVSMETCYIDGEVHTKMRASAELPDGGVRTEWVALKLKPEDAKALAAMMQSYYPTAQAALEAAMFKSS